jgi:hypothetical protein
MECKWCIPTQKWTAKSTLWKKIHLALITETHFIQKTYFNIPGYSLYKTDHPDSSAHAGTAIFISSDIKHYELLGFQEPPIQATIISIQIKNIPIKIAFIYCPPRYKIDFEDFNKFFQLLGHSFIAGGDFNYKNSLWGNRAFNQRASALHRSLIKNHLSFISAPNPT